MLESLSQELLCSQASGLWKNLSGFINKEGKKNGIYRKRGGFTMPQGWEDLNYKVGIDQPFPNLLFIKYQTIRGISNPVDLHFTKNKA